VNLLRIRNPWGNQYEWKGAWSDGLVVLLVNCKLLSLTSIDNMPPVSKTSPLILTTS